MFNKNRTFEVGTYTPTDNFKQITEHCAVMETGTNALIALVGIPDDPESEYLALLFSQAPKLLLCLEELEAEISSRFTANYPEAPVHMTEPLRSIVTQAHQVIASITKK